jgi:hypothetical protein
MAATTIKRKKTTKKTKNKSKPASAFHAATAAGDAIVGVRNLRVLVTKAEGYWFAQGLEIDYAAEAPTLEALKTRFEEGLSLTIRENLKVYGDISRVLVPAPAPAWRDFYHADLRLIHSQMSFHEAACLTSITYLGRAA